MHQKIWLVKAVILLPWEYAIKHTSIEPDQHTKQTKSEIRVQYNRHFVP